MMMRNLMRMVILTMMLGMLIKRIEILDVVMMGAMLVVMMKVMMIVKIKDKDGESEFDCGDDVDECESNSGDDDDEKDDIDFKANNG